MSEHDDSEYSNYMNARQAERTHEIGPSGVHDCYRRHAYRYHETPVERGKNTAAADMGTLMHLGWSALIRAQYDPSEREPDVRIQAEGMPRAGEADDVNYVDRVVTDLKTAKDRVWQMWANQSGPYDSYWDQLELYALGLRQKHGGDWTLRILALNRETGERAEYERAADPEVGQALVDIAATRHAALTASVTDQGAPEDFPREGKGPGRGMPCDWCEFVDVCWPEPSFDGGSPQSETVREDNDAIGALAMDYLEASAEVKKHNAAKFDARAFLEGLDGEFPGPDGATYRITSVGGRDKGPVPDCDAMVELLEGMGTDIPMKDGGTTARYPRVTRRVR